MTPPYGVAIPAPATARSSRGDAPERSRRRGPRPGPSSSSLHSRPPRGRRRPGSGSACAWRDLPAGRLLGRARLAWAGPMQRSRRSRSGRHECAVGPPLRRPMGRSGSLALVGSAARRRSARQAQATTAPSWLRMRRGRAPDGQAVDLVAPVAQRPVADRPLDDRRSARPAGSGRPAARRCGRPRPATGESTGARSASATTGVTSKSLTGIQNWSSRPDDPHARGDRVERDLLGRLAQGGGGEVGVLGFGLAAREADLARVMVAVAGRPLDQDHARVAGRIGIEQDEDGRRSAGSAGRRRPAASGSSAADRGRGITLAAGRAADRGRADRRAAASSKRMGRRDAAALVDELAVVALAATGRRQVQRGGRRSVPAARRPASRSSSAAPRVAAAGLGDDGRALAREHERARREVGVRRDPVARPELARDERPGQRVLDEPLDRPLERPGAVGGVGALADDERLGGRRQLEDDVLLGQPPAQVGEQQVDDGAEVRARSGRGTR